MSDNLRRRRPAPAQGPRVAWLLAGVGVLVVAAGVALGLWLALGHDGPDDPPPAPPGGPPPAATGKKLEAPPGGDLPAELLARARAGLVSYALASDDGHRDRGAGFFFDGDLVLGYDPIMIKHKLGPKGRRYPELVLRPEGESHAPDDLHHFSPGDARGRAWLIVRNPKGAPPLELAERDPDPDDEVFVLGYAGAPPAFRLDRAAVGRRVLTGGTDYSFDLDFAPPADYVYGGPVLDRWGRAVGAAMPAWPGRPSPSLYPVDLMRAVVKGSAVMIDAARKGPSGYAKPKPPEPKRP